MRLLLLLLVGAWVGACTPSHAPAPDGDSVGTARRGRAHVATTAPSTAVTTTAPSTAVSGAVVAPAGKYGWYCKGWVWGEITLAADGSYEEYANNTTTEVRYRGRYAQAQGELTLTPEGGAEPDSFAVREHDGRVVLVRPGQQENWALLPSWALGYVALGPDDRRETFCQGFRVPQDNPEDPAKPGLRVPRSLRLHLWPTAEESRHLVMDLTAAPYEASLRHCEVEKVDRGFRCEGNTIGLDWATLNRLWRKAHRGDPACPPPTRGDRFEVRYEGGGFEGEVETRFLQEAEVADGCGARAYLAYWVHQRVATAYPPTPPPR
jgi:hypothetical protein